VVFLETLEVRKLATIVALGLTFMTAALERYAYIVYNSALFIYYRS
jgi:hypothetical protein